MLLLNTAQGYIRKSVNERVNWKMNGTFLNYWNIFDLLEGF